MIQVENLSVVTSGRVILQDVEFTLPKGSFLAVIGPNGGGKSTLIRTLLGLQAHVGSVVVEPKEAPIGYVPQIKTLDRSFPALTEELVATALKRRWPWRVDAACEDIVSGALHSVGAAHLMGQSIRSLSGGELQRVYLARAMISTPSILVLDEPSAGVDVAGAADMLECVERFRSEHNATVVMVTHDWDVAYHHASHALVLNRELISYGPAQEAINEEVVRQAFGHEGHAHDVFGGGHSHD